MANKNRTLDRTLESFIFLFQDWKSKMHEVDISHWKIVSNIACNKRQQNKYIDDSLILFESLSQ